MEPPESDEQAHPLAARLRTPVGRDGIALLVSVFALFVQYWASAWLGGRSFFLFLYPALFFSAWFGGLRSGLLATIILSLGAWYLLLPLTLSFLLAHPRDAAPLVMFCLMGVVFSIVGERALRLHIKLEQAHRASQAAELRLRALAHSRDTFVSTLTHDLRTPLRAARMSAEIMARQAVADEASKTLLGQILDNLQRLDAMIQSLLDANSLQAGQRLPIRPERFELRAAIQDVLADLSCLHGDRFRLIADHEVSGNWDRQTLRRVVENLASNAVKYGYPDTPVTVRLDDLGDDVRLSVHNDGDPIPADAQAAVFEPFLRLPSARTSRQTGWGIGLALVRGAIDAHDGTVTIHSAAGEGTTFTIVLPKEPPARGQGL
jgi:signal transduction histidine kinase